MSPEALTALIGLAGTIFGGAGLRLVDWFFRTRHTKEDLAAQLRDELRQDTLDLRKEIERQDAEIERWKQKYYDLLDQFYEFKREFGSRS